MAFSKLNGDEAGIIFGQLCNVFEPSVAVAFSSANSGLWALTRALRQQLRADRVRGGGSGVLQAGCVALQGDARGDEDRVDLE